MRPFSWWKRYWFTPEPALNLAVCRILLVGYKLWFGFLATNPIRSEAIRQHAALPAELYDPLPLLHAMIWPVGWNYQPGPEVLEIVVWVCTGVGFLALLGFLTNLSLLLFTVGTLFLDLYFSSFGDFHHVAPPLLIALGLLTLSPCGRVLSLDSLLRRRRAGANQRPRLENVKSPYARWCLLLIGWVLALVYLSAAVSKVNVDTGLNWLNGFTLQWSLLRDGLRWDRPLGVWLAQQHELAVALSWITVLFEGTFFLAVLFRFRKISFFYVAVGTALHLGIYWAMEAPFFTFVLLYSVLLPWHRIWAQVRVRLVSLRSFGTRFSGARKSWTPFSGSP